MIHFDARAGIDRAVSEWGVPCRQEDKLTFGGDCQVQGPCAAHLGAAASPTVVATHRIRGEQRGLTVSKPSVERLGRCQIIMEPLIHGRLRQ